MAPDGRSFYSPTEGRLSFEAVVDTLVATLEEGPDAAYHIIVGTDSHAHFGELDFVSAIILHRLGKGGRYFWQRERHRATLTLRQKIWREAMLSFELAKELMDELQTRTPLDYNLEIHVDVGDRGPTKDLVDEVVGMIVGSGFAVRTKPEAYGAATVADKHT